MKVLTTRTVTLLLALLRFSVAAEVMRDEATSSLPRLFNPEQTSPQPECIQQHEIFPAYLSNSKASVSRLRRTAINVLVVDLHDGMRSELATVAKTVLSEMFGMEVRVLVPESKARWCEFPGLDWWTMCGSEEREAFLRRSLDVPWVREADLIMFSMPPVLLQLLRPLGKPMVVWITVPPEYGRQNAEAYAEWLSDFRSAASDPSIAIISASRYDQMYVRYFYGVATEVIGLSTPGISSSREDEHASADEGGSRSRDPPHRELERRKRATPCSRRKGCVSSGRATQTGAAATATRTTATATATRTTATATATRTTATATRTTATATPPKLDVGTSVGLFPKSSWELPWAAEMFNSSLQDLNVSIIDPGSLEQYRVAIYLPYMRNTNLFLEIYRSGIPIFTPSLAYLVQIDQAHCLMSNRVYWSRTPEPCDRVYPYSPNDLHYSRYPSERAPLAHAFWLERSEQFSSKYPGIIQFDSDEDLRAKLLAVDVHEVRKTMDRQNQRAMQRNIDGWARVIRKLLGAVRDSRDEKRSRVYRPGSDAGPLVQINGTCAPAVTENSFKKAQARINECWKVIGIDWDGFPARHSCVTWPEVYGEQWPGGP